MQRVCQNNEDKNPFDSPARLIWVNVLHSRSPLLQLKVCRVLSWTEGLLPRLGDCIINSKLLSPNEVAILAKCHASYPTGWITTARCISASWTVGGTRVSQIRANLRSRIRERKIIVCCTITSALSLHHTLRFCSFTSATIVFCYYKICLNL